MKLAAMVFSLVLLVAAAALPAAPDESGPVQFEEKLLLDNYGYAYGIGAADLDGDGHIDLVSSDATGGQLYWFANDGKGNFQRFHIMKDEPGWFERLAIGDVNGDGKPDVVVVKNLDGNVVWFENPGNPRDGQLWKRHVIIPKGGLPGAYDVVLVDLDGDGKLDVAASSWRKGNRFVWYRNPGKYGEGEEWPQYIVEDKVPETRTIRAADFNRDGKMDLLGTGREANLVAWYENPGKPADAPWKKHLIDDKSPRPVHGHPVDMDGDGDMDVVMALGMLAPANEKDTHQIVWYENVGKPGDGTTWKKHVVAESFFNAFEAFAADINGDGHLDIVATAWGPKPGGRLVWFENPGDPRQTPWKMHVLKEGWTNANSVIAADLTGSKRLDIIATAERGANELRWWRNLGRPKK